jgi:chromate transporter
MRPGRVAEVFVAFLRLGLTSFGGPVAHLGYFRRAFVVRRRWLDEGQFAEIVGLCSFLPGPTSSQTGVLIGRHRAGWRGAAAAWVGFTLPSAVLMTAFALVVGTLHGPTEARVIHGLKLAAVAIVAQAVVAMVRTLTPDWPRRGIAVAGAGIAAFAGPVGQILAILAGAVAGRLVAPRGSPADPLRSAVLLSRGRLAVAVAVAVAVALAAALTPLVAPASPLAALAAGCFRAGALVFGGGHVVLPLLRSALVPGVVDGDAFLAGYGAAQALPGPLFTFAAYLGGLIGGVAGAAVALVAIFAPGMLLLAAAVPLWSALQARPAARAVVAGVNAAVVGVLAAALVSPLGTGAIHGVRDAGIAAIAVAALLLKAPPWTVVAGCVATALI